MSSIRIKSLAFGLLLSAGLYSLSGCGDQNSRSDLDPYTGKHSGSWSVDHAPVAKADPESCTECHGSDFSGGISRVACTQCHMESVRAPHPSFWNYTSTQPTAWGTYAYGLHARYVRINGTAKCANASCHGAALDGAQASGPSCSSCHMGGPASAHPADWKVKLTPTIEAKEPTVLPDHGAYINANGLASCKTAVCHGNQLQGVFLGGPACTMCHY